MSWQFHIRQRVVCIESDGWGSIRMGGHELPHRVPMLHEVLTITDMKWREDHPHNPGLFLFFAEIPAQQTDGPLTATLGWAAKCFRPLEERKTDISVFTRMLAGDRVAA